MESILKLEPSDDSISRIQRFLNKTSVDDEEHAIVVCHLLSLYSKTKQIDFMVNVVEAFTKKYKSENLITILDKFIELTIDDYRKECLDAINQKKELLNSYDTEIYYQDMILFHKNDIGERIRYINLFLQDDTSKANRLAGMFLLAKAYFDGNEFYKFNKNLDTTKELALELGDFEVFESLLYYEATNYYQLEEYEKSLEILNSNPVRSEYFGSKVNLLTLKIYFKKGNYKRCSILEAKYEEVMERASTDVKKDYYQLCIELYTILQNRQSIELYKQRLKEVSNVKVYKEIDYIHQNIIKAIKIKKPKENTNIETPVFKKIKKTKPTLNEMSDFYQETIDIFKPFQSNERFREQLRLSLIKLNEKVPFNDCYIITKEFESFHFKKERLYIKKDVTLEIIDNFHQSDVEIISFNTQRDNLFNPFNNEIIEFNYATIFPLFTDKCFGAIYFVSENHNMIEGVLNFEKLHCFAKFYNSISVINYEKERVFYETESKLEILGSKMFYYAFSDTDYFYCNKEITNLLGVKNKVTFNSFVSNISMDDYKEFLANYNSLSIEDNYFEQLVTFNNEKKVLIKTTKISDYKLLFIFEDYTKVESNKRDLIVTAYHNPITNLKNNQSLNVEIYKYFDMKKFSAILLNFKDLKKYTYLYQEKFSMDILKCIGQLLPEFNKDYDYYHLNFDKIIVLVKDTNDKRVLKQIINKLDQYLIEKLSLINNRLIPRFTYGTYRSTVDTKEKSLDKMLEILSDSILNVDDFLDENVGFYDIELYKERFLREQLITYISESIDQKNLGILFTQCVNVNDSLIEFYESKLNLSNYKVDVRILEEVIKRKNMTTTLEQYLIQRTFHEMNLISSKIDYSINVVIKIDEYSLVKKSFVNYLEEMAKQFKITKERVILKIDRVYNGAVDNIIYLMNQGYHIALNNIDDLSLVKPSYFLLKNFKNMNEFNDEYIKSLSNILSNLDVKFVLNETNKNEEIEHYKKYINCYMGKVYNQQLTYIDIINIFKSKLGI
ncbi:MAG: hypothetical protein R3Y60_00120 [bacterium]